MSNPDVSVRLVLTLLRADLRRIFGPPRAALVTLGIIGLFILAVLFVKGFWREALGCLAASIVASPLAWLYEDMLRPRPPRPPGPTPGEAAATPSTATPGE